jgi:Ca2+-binding EF-hand superfamily protein
MVEPGENKVVEEPLPPVGPPRIQVWITMILGSVVLISGMAIGIGASMMFLKQEEEETDEPAEVKDPQPSKVYVGKITEEMARDLHLDPEQVEKVRGLVEETHLAMSEIRSEAGEKMREQFQKFDSGMQIVLTEQQYTEFKERMERLNRRHHGYYRGRHHRGGRPGGGPSRGGGPGGGPGMFEKFDKNRDGSLDKDELPEPLWQRMKKADKDEDGTISREELDAWRKSMMQHYRPDGHRRPPMSHRRRPDGKPDGRPARDRPGQRPEGTPPPN